MNYGVHQLGNGLGLMMHKCCECFFIVSENHISTQMYVVIAHVGWFFDFIKNRRLRVGSLTQFLDCL
jgi:hypothetical protein